MPKEGDRKRGIEIGKSKHNLYIWTECKKCHKGRWVYDGQIKDPRYLGLCRKCGNYRNGKIQGAKNKKQGRKKTSTGYIEILISRKDPYFNMAMKSGYIKEHRYIIAKSLGRSLTGEEIVHHKDGDKTNNVLSNLEITTKYTHKIGFSHAYQTGYADGYLKAKKELT